MIGWKNFTQMLNRNGNPKTNLGVFHLEVEARHDIERDSFYVLRITCTDSFITIITWYCMKRALWFDISPTQFTASSMDSISCGLDRKQRIERSNLSSKMSTRVKEWVGMGWAENHPSSSIIRVIPVELYSWRARVLNWWFKQSIVVLWRRFTIVRWSSVC